MNDFVLASLAAVAVGIALEIWTLRRQSRTLK
jgi:hypothetical protein